MVEKEKSCLEVCIKSLRVRKHLNDSLQNQNSNQVFPSNRLFWTFFFVGPGCSFRLTLTLFRLLDPYQNDLTLSCNTGRLRDLCIVRPE